MYSDLIKQATNSGDPEAEQIEEIMRNVIFKSTLDWQTREQLADAARVAQALLRSQQEGR